MLYVETKIEGETVQFELPPTALTGEQPTGFVGDKINKLAKNISEDIIKTILAVGKLAMNAKDSFDKAPAETSVEFGINIDVKGDAVIASSTVGAHIVISFKWAA